MGVLDNTTITVDAILTKKGRELLAKGQGQFNITKSVSYTHLTLPTTPYV